MRGLGATFHCRHRVSDSVAGACPCSGGILEHKANALTGCGEVTFQPAWWRYGRHFDDVHRARTHLMIFEFKSGAFFWFERFEMPGQKKGADRN